MLGATNYTALDVLKFFLVAMECEQGTLLLAVNPLTGSIVPMALAKKKVEKEEDEYDEEEDDEDDDEDEDDYFDDEDEDEFDEEEYGFDEDDFEFDEDAELEAFDDVFDDDDDLI